MAWLEFNIHIRNRMSSLERLFLDVRLALIDLLRPFIEEHRNRLDHWHYLVEPDDCRGANFAEVRLRFEAETTNLRLLKDELVSRLSEFSNRTSITMREDEHLGSHEGEHGHRNQSYRGAQSEQFGADWPTMVEIMQVGSQFALEILRLSASLTGSSSLVWNR